MLEELLHHYGYLAVILGPLVLGEIPLVIAGYLATKGIMNLFLIIFFGCIGIVVIDQLFFLLGYYWGAKILRKFPKLQVNRVESWIRKHKLSYILFFRFLYGIRAVVPLSAGMSRIKPATFFLLNTLGAILWVTPSVFGGYYFGKAFGTVVISIGKQLTLITLVALLFFIIAKGVVKKRRINRKKEEI